MTSALRLYRRELVLSMVTLSSIALMAFSCDPGEPPCDKSEVPLLNSFNTYIANGAPVATFRLTQTFVEDSPIGCHTDDAFPVFLTLTSTAPVPLRFDYTLQGRGATGLIVWTYQASVARLEPGQVLDVGQVASTPVRADIGATVALSNVLQLP